MNLKFIKVNQEEMWITTNKNQGKAGVWTRDMGSLFFKNIGNNTVTILHTEKGWETIYRIFQSLRCDPKTFKTNPVQKLRS